jgi:hypothetical protein
VILLTLNKSPHCNDYTGANIEVPSPDYSNT